MSDTILDVQGLVGGYGKMTILNGTTFSVPTKRNLGTALSTA